MLNKNYIRILKYVAATITIAAATLSVQAEKRGWPEKGELDGALNPVVDKYNNSGKPFKMGMVFPVSTHNYELRYWLAASGIHPGYYAPHKDDTSGQIKAKALLSLHLHYKCHQQWKLAISADIVMMTNGPNATISEILDINLSRPRNRIELADDAKYNHYRTAVLRFLYEKQRKVETITVASNKPKKAKKTDAA